MKIKVILSCILICGILIYFLNDEKKIKNIKFSKEHYSEVIPIDENISFLKKDNKYVYLNGNMKNDVNYTKIIKLSKNYLKVVEDREKLLNKQNAYLELPKFETIESISEDRYVLLKNNGNYFYYDLLEKKIITDLYEKLGNFKENRAYFVRNGMLGFLDENGEEIIENIYSAVGEFTNGYAIVVKNEGEKYSVINKFGFEIFRDCDYVKIYSDGEFILKKDKKNILKTKYGEFETEDFIEHLKSGFYLISKGNIHRIFSSEKQKTIKELNGEYLGISKDTILIKIKDGVLAYNFINGKERLLKYDDIRKYEEDYIIGVKDEKLNLILKNGKTILKGFDLVYPKAFEMFIVGEESGYGVLNENGERLLESKYDEIQLTPEYIIVEENEKKGIFNKYGERILDTKYIDIQYRNGHIYTLDEDGWRYSLLN